MVAPTKEVQPTINKEYDVAIIGCIPIMYTKIGKVKIEPPPPIKPKEMPTRAAKKKPINSILFYFQGKSNLIYSC